MNFYSDWYPPEVNPVRDGLYIMPSAVSSASYLREFKDGSWRYADGSPMKAPFIYYWRGLSFDATWVVDTRILRPGDVMQTHNGISDTLQFKVFATEVAKKD